MSVKTLESYQEFTASGSATFTFNFNYVDSSEIVVGMRTGDNQYTVVDPVNYVLTQNASTDGGKIRFVTTKPCENPDDPTCGDYIDNPPPAGTIVRIERKTVQSSTADWYVGLDMKALVGLFDKLFRISQENSDKFKNTIQTFPTQQGITVRELLSEHDKKIFYWNNEKQWLDITDFTIDDVLKQTDVGDILEQANAYSDEQNALLENRINGKLTAVDAQIDANADAIQKTREDYINADSEIHQILNNHTSELTTLRGNQASLGDQVAGIEEKIPGDASATNQLATKADLKGAADGDFVKKSGDTMTGDLAFDVVAGGYTVAFQDSYENVGTGNTDSVIKRIQSNHSTQGLIFSETKNGTVTMQFTMLADGFVMPHGNRLLGNSDYPWENIYAKKLNNGADIAIPTEGGTLARIEDLTDYDLSGYLPLSGGELTGKLTIKPEVSDTIGEVLTLSYGNNDVVIRKNRYDKALDFGNTKLTIGHLQASDLFGPYDIGEPTGPFRCIYVTQISSSTSYSDLHYLLVPNKDGTIATVEDLTAGNVSITFAGQEDTLQNAINTLKTEQDELGGQVSGIEEKIPESASSSNPLSTAQDLSAGLFDLKVEIAGDISDATSPIQTQVEGISAEVARKQDKLTAGANITIVDNVISATGGGGGDSLPDQTDNEGALLTTDGTNPQWKGFVGYVGDDTFGTKNYAVILDPANKQTSDYKTGLPRTAINPQGDTASYGTNIGGTATGTGSTSIGNNANARGGNSVVIGSLAYATGAGSIAVGSNAKVTRRYSIQLGNGTNDTEQTFSVALGASNNYRLLEADGTIPAERIGNLDFGTMD